VVRQIAEWDEGHVVSTLDPECNGRASRWGSVKEYRRWFEFFVDRARVIVKRPNAHPLRGMTPFEIHLPYDAHPARFTRQVVGMFLAVQATEQLLAEHPVLAELIGPDPDDGSGRRVDGLGIAPLHLYVSVCNAQWGYLDRPMLAAQVSLGVRNERLWTPPPSGPTQLDDTLMLCLAPFAFVMTTRNATDLGHDISHWATGPVDRRPRSQQRRLLVPTADQLQSGLRAMVFPHD
jgi:hypothetical protein